MVADVLTFDVDVRVGNAVLLVKLDALLLVASHVDHALTGDHQTEGQGVDNDVATHDVAVHPNEGLLRHVGRIACTGRHAQGIGIHVPRKQIIERCKRRIPPTRISQTSLQFRVDIDGLASVH